MWVGTKVGSRIFLGASVSSLVVGGLLLAFGLVGAPIMIVMEIVKMAQPIHLNVGEWSPLTVLVLAVIGGLWMYINARPHPDPGYMSPEERAEIMTKYPDDAHEPERLRPNRLRQPNRWR
jgi:hypothetical protein